MMAIITTNLPTTNLEDTIKYFEILYEQPIQISQQVMDIVYSFFIDKADNDDAALALVHAVIFTSMKFGTDPIEVIDEFKKYDGLQLDQRLVAFLNSSRGNTSMLGIGNSPVISYHIARTLLP